MKPTQLLLLAGAGYLVYSYLKSRQDVEEPGGGGGSTQTGGGSSTNTNPTGADTYTLLKNYAAANAYSTRTFDEWNWIYSYLRPNAPAPWGIEAVLPGTARDAQLTLDQWWAASNGHGVAGLGAIVEMDPYNWLM